MNSREQGNNFEGKNSQDSPYYTRVNVKYPLISKINIESSQDPYSMLEPITIRSPIEPQEDNYSLTPNNYYQKIKQSYQPRDGQLQKDGTRHSSYLSLDRG